jgi:hypothetical protein
MTLYGEVGIGLLAKVMRGLRYDGDWLPPTPIVTLPVSPIKHASEVLAFCSPSTHLLLISLCYIPPSQFAPGLGIWCLHHRYLFETLRRIRRVVLPAAKPKSHSSAGSGHLVALLPPVSVKYGVASSELQYSMTYNTT